MSGTDTSHLVDGKYAITDLVDLEQLREIFEKFTRATGFTIGFLDHPGLNVLVASGWQDICTKFHRGCEASAAVCTTSNAHLLDQLVEPNQLVIEPCDHGLVDCATPIIIKGKHIASLATGQLLLEEPDLDRFRRQARTFGYDEQEYLAALAQIPVVSEVQLRHVTSFLGSLAAVVSGLGYATLKVKEEAEILEQEIAERRRVEGALRESEERFSAFMENLPAAAFVKDTEGRTLFVNRYLQELLGFQDWEGKTTPELVAGERGARMVEGDRRALAEGPVTVLETMTDGDGATRSFETFPGQALLASEPGVQGARRPRRGRPRRRGISPCRQRRSMRELAWQPRSRVLRHRDSFVTLHRTLAPPPSPPKAG